MEGVMRLRLIRVERVMLWIEPIVERVMVGLKAGIGGGVGGRLVGVERRFLRGEARIEARMRRGLPLGERREGRRLVGVEGVMRGVVRALRRVRHRMERGMRSGLPLGEHREGRRLVGVEGVMRAVQRRMLQLRGGIVGRMRGRLSLSERRERRRLAGVERCEIRLLGAMEGGVAGRLAVVERRMRRIGDSMERRIGSSECCVNSGGIERIQKRMKGRMFGWTQRSLSIDGSVERLERFMNQRMRHVLISWIELRDHRMDASLMERVEQERRQLRISKEPLEICQ